MPDTSSQFQMFLNQNINLTDTGSLFLILSGTLRKTEWTHTDCIEIENVLKTIQNIDNNCRLSQRSKKHSIELLQFLSQPSSCFISPLIRVFCHLAYIQGPGLDSSPKYVGTFDTLNSILKLLIKLLDTFNIQTFLVTTDLCSPLERTRVAILKKCFQSILLPLLMVIENAVACDQASCLETLLDALFIFLPIFTTDEETETLYNKTITSISLKGIFTQCLSRLLGHLSNKHYFFDSLHDPKNHNKKLGNRLIGNKILFRKTFQVMNELIKQLSNGTDDATQTVSKHDSNFKKNRLFLLNVYPGLLSQLCNLIIQRDLSRLGGDFLIRAAIQMIHRLILCIMSDCYWDISILPESKVASFIRSCLSKQNTSDLSSTLSPGPLDHSLTLLKKKPISLQNKTLSFTSCPTHLDTLRSYSLNTRKTMIFTLRVLLHYQAQTISNITLSSHSNQENRSFVVDSLILKNSTSLSSIESKNNNVPKSISLVLCDFCIELFEQCHHSLFDFSDTEKDSEALSNDLLVLCLEGIVTSLFMIQIMCDPTEMSSFIFITCQKKLEVLIRQPFFLNALSEQFSRVITSINPTQLALSINGTSQIIEGMIRIIGFVTALFPSTSTVTFKRSTLCDQTHIVFQMKDMLNMLLPLFQIDWHLTKQLMLDTTSCCVSHLELWLDRVPINETLLLSSSVAPHPETSGQIMERFMQIFGFNDPDLFCFFEQQQEIKKRCQIPSYVTNDSFKINDMTFSQVIDALNYSLILNTEKDKQLSDLIQYCSFIMQERTSVKIILQFILEILTALDCPQSGYKQSHMMSTTLWGNTWKSSQMTQTSIPSPIPIVSLMKRLSALYFLISSLQSQLYFQTSLQTTTDDTDAQDMIVLLWTIIDELTTSIELGGCWIDQTIRFSQSLLYQLHLDTNDIAAQSSLPLSFYDRIAITQLTECMVMACLVLIIRFLKRTHYIPSSRNQKAHQDIASVSDLRSMSLTKSITSRTIHFILGRLKLFSFEVLKKIGSEYRLTSISGLTLMEEIMSFCSLFNQQQNDLITQQSASFYWTSDLVPCFIDAFLNELKQCEINSFSNNDGTNNFYPLIDPALGQALLAMITFGNDQSIYLMKDIVTWLINYSTHHHAISHSTSPAYRQLLWVVKAQAGIAKRLSGILTLLQKDQQTQSPPVINQLNPDMIRNEPSPICDKTTTVNSLLFHQALHLLIGSSNIPKNHSYSRVCDLTSMQSITSTSHTLDSDVINTVPTLFITMSSELCLSSRHFFLHLHPDIQFLSHLTCLYSLHCHSITRQHILPKIHQIWESLKVSLSRPLLLPESNKQPHITYSVLLLAALILRYSLIVSEEFLTSRFVQQIFPIVSTVLENTLPIKQIESASKPTLLRTQLILLDILNTSASNRLLFKSISSRCLGIAIRFWDRTVSKILYYTSLKLAIYSILFNPEKSILILIAIASLIVNKHQTTISLYHHVPKMTSSISELKRNIERLINTPFSTEDASHIVSFQCGLSETTLFKKRSSQLRPKINFLVSQSDSVQSHHLPKIIECHPDDFASIECEPFEDSVCQFLKLLCFIYANDIKEENQDVLHCALNSTNKGVKDTDSYSVVHRQRDTYFLVPLTQASIHAYQDQQQTLNTL